MDRRLVPATAVVIVLTTLASGPLVPAVDFTTAEPDDGSQFCEPSGNASVDVVEPPNRTIELTQERFGSDLYRLPGAETVVEVTDIEGCPVVVYELTIPELGTLNRRLYWTNSFNDSRATLEVVRSSFDPESVEGKQFDGTVTVKLRGDTNRTVFRTNVTIRGPE